MTATEIPPGSASRVVRLRGHTLLCFQGFRGEGYSPEFVANLAELHRYLSDHPETWVEVLDRPDEVCAACPHHAATGCTLRGPGSEAEMHAQDLDVLRRLAVPSGTRLRWADILDRIRAAVSPDDLPDICGTCQWLPLGYCREGLTALRDHDSQQPKRSLPMSRRPR